MQSFSITKLGSSQANQRQTNSLHCTLKKTQQGYNIQTHHLFIDFKGPVRPVRTATPVLVGPVKPVLVGPVRPVSGTSSRQSSATGLGRSYGTALVCPLKQFPIT
jgi:hypothetical protein